MYLKELTNQEFQEFINQYPASSFYQTPEYAFLMNEQDCDSILLGLVDSFNKVVAASLILIQKRKSFKYAYAPRGFLIDYQNKELLKIFTNEIKKYLGERNIIAIKISPLIVKNIHDVNHNKVEENPKYPTIFQNLTELEYYHLGYNHYFEAIKPRFEAIINLDIPYYELFQNFHKSYQTKIRGAVKNGVQIFKGTKEQLEYLYLHTKKKYPRDLKYYQDCYNFFDKNGKIDFYYAKLNTQQFLNVAQKTYLDIEQKSNQINDHIMMNAGKSSSKTINKKIQLDQEYEKAKNNMILATNLLRDYPDGIVLASSLVIKHKEEVYMIMDGLDLQYKSFNAKHLLIWKIIERYSNQHYKKFNFGGVTDPNLQENKYKGLNDFRLSFNSNIYEYAGDFELITNSKLYFLYRNVPLKNIFKR